MAAQISAADSKTTGTFTILYFAGASSFTARSAESLPAPLPAHQLFALLETRYPGFHGRILRSCLVTVNQDYIDLTEPDQVQTSALPAEEGLVGSAPADRQTDPPNRSATTITNDRVSRDEHARKGMVIQPGDEVAIIPPVSSG